MKKNCFFFSNTTSKPSFPKYYWIVYNTNCWRNCSTILNFLIVGPEDSRTAVTLIWLLYLLGIKLNFSTDVSYTKYTNPLDCWHACYQNILFKFLFWNLCWVQHINTGQNALSNIFADQSGYIINNSSYLSEGY